MINLLIYSPSPVAETLENALRKIESIKMIGIMNTSEELEKVALEYDHLVVIWNTCDSDINRNNSLFEFLNRNKILCLCLCRNAADGFFCLSKGASQMQVVSPALETYGTDHFANIMKIKIHEVHKMYQTENGRVLKNVFHTKYDKIIAIGSSTGGTKCVTKILSSLPANSPPIVIVQHMPPVFTKIFAEDLNRTTQLTVWEAKDGDALTRGLVLIAPGEYQMTMEKRESGFVVRCLQAERVGGHCPSVNVLFDSVADVVGKQAVGVILTGMGSDGATGLLRMRNHGAMTFGQNESSCVVYGMPKVAYEVGAVVEQSSVEGIIDSLLKYV